MFGNRAHETSATSGTGTYVLDGPADVESQSLVDARKKASGDAVGPWSAGYVARQTGGQYEIGRGVLSEGTGPGGKNELTRIVEESSNGDAPVNWGGGSRDIFLAPSAKDFETLLDALASNGILAQTAAKTWARRTLQDGTHIVWTNPDGVSGNPELDDSALDTTFAKLAFDASKAFTAEPILANTIALQGKESGGTKRNLVVIDGSNVLLVGDGANVLKLQPSSLANLFARVGGTDYEILTDDKIPYSPAAGDAGKALVVVSGGGDYEFQQFQSLDPDYASASWTALDASSILEEAHGLSVIPRRYRAVLRLQATNTEHGFDDGHRIYLEGGSSLESTVGYTLWCDDTNVGIRRAPGMQVWARDDGAKSSLTLADWEWMLEAWI